MKPRPAETPYGQSSQASFASGIESTDAFLPLDGLRVVDLTMGMAGPLATMILADFGADVIKVEPPRGDWARSEPAFDLWNRGKKSIFLDLKQARSRRTLHRLADASDVLVESFRPHIAGRLGVDYPQLAAHNPGLIYCSISGFGEMHQFAEVKAYEGVVSAMTGGFVGLDDLSGAAAAVGAHRPVFKLAEVCSFASSQLAVHSILAALHARRTDGRGQHVSTSLIQGAALIDWRTDFAWHPRSAESETRLADTTTFHGIRLTFLTVECADGKWIQMCARQDHHFRNWMQCLGLEDVLEDPRFEAGPLRIVRLSDIDELESRIRAQMRVRTREAWMQAFVEADVGADPFMTPAEFLRHPQMEINGRVLGKGSRRQLGPLVTTRGSAFASADAPKPNEHESHVRELLRDAKSVAQPAAQSQAAFADYPLEGVTVVELAYYIAGPAAGAVLAALGARVIKVEPLAGDPFRKVGVQAAPMLAAKESLAIDLKDREGREVLERLVRKADVFFTSFRPRAVTKLGCDYDALHAINPNLVYVYASSYGTAGTWSERPAFHSTPNAWCGAGLLQAGSGNAPVDDSWPDPASGLAVATAILLGLEAQAQGDPGRYLETSMLCSSGYAFSRHLMGHESKSDWRRPDSGQHGISALERLYPCASGWLFVQVAQEHEWRALAQAIDRPDCAADPRFATAEAREVNDAELSRLLQDLLSERSAEEWEDRLGAAGVPAARADTDDLLAFLQRHGMSVAVDDHVVGRHWRLPDPFTFERQRTRRGPVCSVGEHTRTILLELGYDSDTVAALAAAAVVRCAGEEQLGGSAHDPALARTT